MGMGSSCLTFSALKTSLSQCCNLCCFVVENNLWKEIGVAPDYSRLGILQENIFPPERMHVSQNRDVWGSWQALPLLGSKLRFSGWMPPLRDGRCCLPWGQSWCLLPSFKMALHSQSYFFRFYYVIFLRSTVFKICDFLWRFSSPNNPKFLRVRILHI